MVLVGFGVAACGGELPGLAEAVDDSASTGGAESSFDDDTNAASTGDGWGGGGDEGSSSESSGDGPTQPETDPGPDGNAVLSGTRLHRRELETSDGASAETSLWDSALAVPCSFEPASDGESRCIPDLHGTVMFADPQCTQPVIAAYWSCVGDDLRYARRSVAEGDCDRSVETYAAIEGEDPVLRPVFWLREGDCVADGTRQSVLAQRLPDSDLVRATRIESPRTQGMSMRMLLAEDGAVWPETVIDQGRGEPCSPDRESERCVPASAGWFSERDLLHDASCEQRAVEVDACQGSTLRGRESTCAPMAFYEHGEEVGALAQRGLDDICEPLEDVTGTHVTVGAAIPIETFPPAEVATVGEGRIREQRMVDTAGDSLVTGLGGRRLYDTALDLLCHPMRMADGTIRCLPPVLTLHAYSLYADDQCTEPVVAAYADACDGTTIPASYAAAFESCGEVSSIYTLDEELGAEQVYWDGGGTCSPAPSSIADPPHFRLGEAVPLETFAALEYVVHER